MAPLLPWLRAFLLTVLVETPIAAALLREAEPRLARRVRLILLANLATHPLVWFAFPALGLGDALGAVVPELFAVAVEAAIYRLALRGRAPALACAGVSALANGASYGAGALLYALRGAI